jgi:hypothetical protein
MNAFAQIIAGGGWKKIRKERIKVKAWCFFLTFVLLAGIGTSYFDQFGCLVFLLAAVPLLIAVVLFFREMPVEVDWPAERGEDDPRKL